MGSSPTPKLDWLSEGDRAPADTGNSEMLAPDAIKGISVGNSTQAGRLTRASLAGDRITRSGKVPTKPHNTGMESIDAHKM